MAVFSSLPRITGLNYGLRRPREERRVLLVCGGVGGAKMTGDMAGRDIKQKKSALGIP